MLIFHTCLHTRIEKGGECKRSFLVASSTVTYLHFSQKGRKTLFNFRERIRFPSWCEVSTVNGKHTSQNIPLISWQGERRRNLLKILCVLNIDVVLFQTETRKFFLSHRLQLHMIINFPTPKTVFEIFKLNKLFSSHSIASMLFEITLEMDRKFMLCFDQEGGEGLLTP